METWSEIKNIFLFVNGTADIGLAMLGRQGILSLCEYYYLYGMKSIKVGQHRGTISVSHPAASVFGS